MKYICIQFLSDDRQEIVLFSKQIDHDKMFQCLRYLDVMPRSAGFVSDDWECIGESITLGLSARPKEDTSLLKLHRGL